MIFKNFDDSAKFFLRFISLIYLFAILSAYIQQEGLYGIKFVKKNKKIKNKKNKVKTG